MVYNLPDIRKASLTGKRVFLRADLDVPLNEFKVQSSRLAARQAKFKVVIEDDTRLRAWMPTLQYLLDHDLRVVVTGKLGRPTGIDEKLSLLPIAVWLGQKYQISNIKYQKVGEFDGWEITPKVFLLENLQFDPKEKLNDPLFAQKLANLADVYVNDAFAMCHRDHASVTGVAKILPHFAGFRLQEEIKMLGSLFNNPSRPFVVVIGGAKIETKLPLVMKMCKLADYVLVGGKIAMERQMLVKAQECGNANSEVVIADSNFEGTDISDRSLLVFNDIIRNAKTVVWNGPIGLIQNSEFRIQNSGDDTERGTRELAKVIAQSGAYTVVGGGDTLEFLHRVGLVSKYSFVSTGGGAMLAFLAGEKLPGLEAMRSLL